MSKQKLIYCILKEIEKGNRPDREKYNLELEQFGEIIELILSEGFIKNAQVIRAGIGNNVKGCLIKDAKVTLKGMNYLEENSGWAKSYNLAKEIRDWIK